MNTTNEQEFKVAIYRLSNNLTVSEMAKAIGKACGKKAVTEEILAIINKAGNKAHKSMDFNRCADLLSVACFNNDWNHVSALLKKEAEESKPRQFHVDPQHGFTDFTNGESACRLAPIGKASDIVPVSKESQSRLLSDEYANCSPNEFLQAMFELIEYRDGIEVVATGEKETSLLENHCIEISLTVYFKTEEMEDSESGYFDITYNEASGQFIGWSTGCSGIDNIIGDDKDISVKAGGFYTALQRDLSPVTYIAIREHKEYFPVKHELIRVLNTDTDDIDDFWEEMIRNDTFNNVTLVKRDKIRDQYAWDNDKNLPFINDCQQSNMKMLFKLS